MQRHTIASLVALQCVVACGYAVEAQDATTRWGTGHASGVILVTTKR